MRAETRGFLLFGFAFSFVLTSPENAIPSNNFNDKVVLDPMNTPNNPEKSINLMVGTTTQEPAHDMEKRAVMFSPENAYGERLGDENSNVGQDKGDLGKRSKMGFTGMRGKKECSVEGAENCGRLTGSNDESALDTTKRALRGFGGWFGGKRAPLSFHGMRGKKAGEYGNDIAGPELFDYKATMPTEEFLINSGLLDDGNSKPELDLSGLSGPKPEEEEIFDGEPFNKRSPYSFQGMRGKKSNLYDFKRAMGFLGMRGKKETRFWYPDGFYKRVPQSSFFGMKGKKAQFNGFFGMRGKKASSPPFLDLQDQQEPLIYDMGEINLDEMRDFEPSGNRFRRGTAWWNNSKKAKNAFFGIRGKKMIEESVKNRFPATFE